MNKFIITCCCLLLIDRLAAQNVGIGTAAPTVKLEIVNGGLLVNEAASFSNTPPTASQTITMVNGMTQELPADDSVGRVYDPGGFFGDYAPNTQATVNIQFASFPSVGFQFVLEDLQLGAGDSLVIISLNGIDQPSFVIRAFTGIISAPVTFTAHSKVRIIFKSNGDASVGRGFSLLVRKLVKVPGASGVTNFFGNHFFFDPVKGALRMNTHYDDSIGHFSVAMAGGSATGYNAIALGSNANAKGPFSIALGGSISEGMVLLVQGLVRHRDNFLQHLVILLQKVSVHLLLVVHLQMVPLQ